MFAGSLFVDVSIQCEIFCAMAREDELAWTTLDEVTKAAKAFLDPVLKGDIDAMWSPETWTWGAPLYRSPRRRASG